MINHKIKKTEGGINSGQCRDAGNSGHQTQNEDKQSKHTTMKTKKRSNIFMVCKGKYHLNCADEIFRGMWLSFIKIKGNYHKLLLFVTLKHNSALRTIC